MARLMVYGASGFTGGLILRSLAKRGIAFVVAGRSEERLRPVADAYDAPLRVFDLADGDVVAHSLGGTDVLLNAAGPFSATTAPLVRGCLEGAVHYMDVSGEVRPLELLARLDGAARARKIMLLPSVGFDVVPSDCLAVHLARRLPGAEELTLSIQGSDLLSRGSARSFADHAGVPVFVRKGGTLEPLFGRTQIRWTDFGEGPRATIATSWGDLVTAFRSTGIGNIEVYFEATLPRWLGIAGNQHFGWAFRAPLARAWFRAAANLVPEGPSEAERQRHGAHIVGEVRKGRQSAQSVISTTEAYTFTAAAAAAAVERVLDGAIAPGFHTPGSLFGCDFALSVGAVRRDLS